MSLFNPLLKAEQYYILEYLQSEMELKVHELQIKNPAIDFSDAKKKIELIQNAKDFIYRIWEEGYVLNNRLTIVESLNIDLRFENEKFKKEIEQLKNNINL